PCIHRNDLLYSFKLSSTFNHVVIPRTTSRSACNDETFFLFLFITTIEFFQKKVACCHHFSGNNFSNVFAHFFCRYSEVKRGFYLPSYSIKHVSNHNP